MGMTYGISIVNNENRFLRAMIAAVDTVSRVLVPGKFLVDSIPICASHWVPINPTWRCLHPTLVKYVPEWFPGAGFKTTAREIQEMFDICVDVPLEHVKESMKVSLRSNLAQRRSLL